MFCAVTTYRGGFATGTHHIEASSAPHAALQALRLAQRADAERVKLYSEGDVVHWMPLMELRAADMGAQMHHSITFLAAEAMYCPAHKGGPHNFTSRGSAVSCVDCAFQPLLEELHDAA